MKRLMRISISLIIICSIVSCITPVALAAEVFVTTDHARFRTGASTNSEVIRTLSPGTSIEVLEHEPAGWSKVRVGDTDGYIRSDLITLPAAAFPATFRTTDGVNLRADPSTDGEVVRRINVGSAVEVLEHDPAGWSRVRYEGDEGYIRSDYLMRRVARANQNAGSSGSSSGNTIVLWTTDGVNLRSRPSTDSSVIKTVPRGTAVSVLDYNPSGWSSVRVGASSGYIRSDFLRPGNGSVELLEWAAVKKLITRHVPYLVIDARTGTQYSIQAFSLGNHADVEPPTTTDTEILYNLYGRAWSWNPRPVWVLIDGRLIAAAINGMPHGGGVISGNGMNGQICLHFYGSFVHNGNASYARQMQGGVMEAYELSR